MIIEARALRSGASVGRPDLGGPAVVLANVDIDLAGVPVLRRVDMRIEAGETVGLVGPNGSGKSTLLRVLATLLRPVSGTGRVLGAELGSAGVTAVRPSIALVGHEPTLYPRLSLVENLRFVARLIGCPETEPVRALDAVGLDAVRHRRAAQCSHGMLRRAELARVLLLRPRLLLLDEAHAGLDEASSGLVEAVVARVRSDGGSSVLVSHERGRLVETVDRLVQIAGGRLCPVEVSP